MNPTREVTNELYAGFSERVRRELAKHEQIVTVPRGTRLLLCGTLPGHLAILNSGSAEISVLVGEKTLSLGISGSGNVFALQSVLSGEASRASVTCLEECRVTLLPKEAFLGVLRSNPEMYFAIIKILSADLASVDAVIRDRGLGLKSRRRSNSFKSM
jgi:CRP-like cAMP-binding protein